MSNADTRGRHRVRRLAEGHGGPPWRVHRPGGLAEIGERRVAPLCSTYFHVLGDEVEWSEIAVMFASSGQNWGGAAFFPTKAVPHGGLVDDRTARSRLAEIESKVRQDRMVLNEGHFFDVLGRRIKIAPIADA